MVRAEARNVQSKVRNFIFCQRCIEAKLHYSGHFSGALNFPRVTARQLTRQRRISALELFPLLKANKQITNVCNKPGHIYRRRFELRC